MDNKTFLKGLSSFALFPSSVIAYATDVGASLDDAGRDALFQQLQEKYGSLQPLEDERVKKAAGALEQLQTFNTTVVKPLKKRTEAAQNRKATKAIEQQF
jgi:hypothetical protein